MRRQSGVAALLLFVFASSHAAASGGFACEAGDRDVTFAIGGATARDQGANIVHVTGHIEVKGGPATQVERGHIAQYWNDAGSFRMIVSVQLGDTESLLLTIDTRGRGDWTYKGQYALVAGKIKRSGVVSCDARG